jgi:hypothetical protein
MIRRISTSVALNAVTEATLSEKFLVEDCRHIAVHLILNGATGTFKVKASDSNDVDFSEPSTVSNPWYYVDLKGVGDGQTSVTGSTGVTTTAETSSKKYAINEDFIRWVAIDAEVLSAGTASAILSRATNE